MMRRKSRPKIKEPSAIPVVEGAKILGRGLRDIYTDIAKPGFRLGKKAVKKGRQRLNKNRDLESPEKD